MTALRHRCRNTPHCGLKLPEPVENPHRAFCCRGCYTQFYRKRCLVCERSIERTAHNRRLCERRKCGADFRAFPHLYVYRLDDPSSASKPTSETPGFIGSEAPVWRHIAGPKLSTRSFALATLPLEPKFAARIARQNRAGGVARTVPVNLMGGYRCAGADPLERDLGRYVGHVEARLLGDPLPVVDDAPSIMPADPFEVPAFLRRSIPERKSDAA